jgi:hypothetical protein
LCRNKRTIGNVTEVKGVVDDDPGQHNQTDAPKYNNQTTVPSVQQEVGQAKNDTARHQEKTARQIYIRAIAIRRHRERRKRTFKFWIESVAALATVGIVCLTGAYVHYSSKQWQTMRDTLTYQIEQTRARLVVEELNISDFPTRPYARFTIENDGHAMADEINVGILRPAGKVGGEHPFGPAPDQPTTVLPDVNGSALGDGKSRPYQVSIRELPDERPTFAEIESGQPHTGFWFQIIVAYRDTASGKSYPASSCIYFESHFSRFFPCINVQATATGKR